MNARQKAKMYKQKYEELLNQPVRFNVVTPKIDTLKFEQFFPREYLDNVSVKYLYKCVTNGMVEELKKYFDHYIRYSIDYCSLALAHTIQRYFQAISENIL